MRLHVLAPHGEGVRLGFRGVGCGYASTTGDPDIRSTGAPRGHPRLRWEGVCSYLALRCLFPCAMLIRVSLSQP